MVEEVRRTVPRSGARLEKSNMSRITLVITSLACLASGAYLFAVSTVALDGSGHHLQPHEAFNGPTWAAWAVILSLLLLIAGGVAMWASFRSEAKQ